MPLLRRTGVNLAAFIETLRRPRRIPGGVRGWRPSNGRIALVFVLAVMVIVMTMLWIDIPAIIAARRLPKSLLQAAGEFTNLGKSNWFLLPSGFVVLAAAMAISDRLSRFSQLVLATIAVRAGFLFVAIGLPGLFGTIIKRLIGRSRPFVGGGPDAFLFKPFVWRVEYASFPSGHATTAFAAAIAIGALWPCTRVVVWGYAILIAISRVVVTAHHPSDVLGSAITGVIGALLIWQYFAARRLGFAIGPDGVARPLPGPSLKRLKAIAARLHGA